MRFRTAAATALLAFAFAAGCRERLPAPAGDSQSAPKSASAAPSSDGSTAEISSYDLAANLSQCEIRHRGLSIDVGTPAADLRRTYTVGPFTDVVAVERAGATFGRVSARSVAYEFWLDTPEQDLIIGLRVHGAGASAVHVDLDGKRVGSAKLPKGETKVLNLPVVRGETPAGRHVITVRFSGRAVSAGEWYAELDWIRIGVQDDLTSTYAAPTLQDVLTEVALDDKPRRSIVLRAPSTVRCNVQPAPATELRGLLGFWGEGSGEAEIRVVRDGEQSVEAFRRKVAGGAGATWTPIRVPLADYAGQLVGVELRVPLATRGGRVVFAEPTIVRGEAAGQRVPGARTVIVVIAAGLDRRRMPPWGPTAGLSALGELARVATAFSAYRVPTTIASGVVASLLSGMPPRAHSLEDHASALPQSVRTISEILKEAGGRTAMFTGVPTTFATFGFDAGWDRYDAISPVSDLPGHEPITRATNWLQQELTDSPPGLKRLVVVHTRGAHPPWDLTREEVALLHPEEYGGAIDARRGAIVLSGIRTRNNRAERRLSEEDWTRLRALEDAAMLKQNNAIASMIAALKRSGAWDDALFVLVGDVGRGDAPDVPFDPAAPLTEDRLLVPLIVKFPGGQLAGKDASAPVTTMDLAQTIVRSLSLKSPEGFSGLDLHASATGAEPVAGRGMTATLGRSFTTRLGRYLLRGALKERPQLCQLDIDPACANDVLAERPLAASALWRATYEAESSARLVRQSERQPARIDPDTAAALTVWGDIP